MAKILIIDDDPDIIESMRVVLESKGYEVIFALGGGEGLAKTKEVKPDLIILDIMLETQDMGFDVARALKKQSDSRDIPVLMLTSIKEKLGFDFKHEAGDQAWLPVDDYCDKPLSPKELLKKVEGLLGKK